MLRKVVFPAAGMGTRFLPVTKAIPKEMLAIVDKPLIQYSVEEALASGMHDIIMVTGRGKRAIEDHFDISFELERLLFKAGKQDLLEKITRISRMTDMIYVRQKMPFGLGHAVQCATNWIGDEPFAVSLADELILGKDPALMQLRRAFEQTGCSVIGLAQVNREETQRYGIVAAEKENGLWRIHRMVEKPKPEEAPSNLAIIGRYIFTPTLLPLLRETPPGKGGEIQLTDAMERLLAREPVYGLIIEGERFDAGNPLGFLQANIALGLRHPHYGGILRDYLKRLL